jgi:hypothetical protein
MRDCGSADELRDDEDELRDGEEVLRDGELIGGMVAVVG